MEQEFDKSGFNWQKYYRNVKKGCNHTRATIYVSVHNNSEILELLEMAKTNDNVNWVVDSSRNSEKWTLMSPLANVLFVKWDALPDVEKTEFWSKVDYIVADTNDLSLVLPAMFSGVELITKDDVKVILGSVFDATNQRIRRINAFSKAKNLFDTL